MFGDDFYPTPRPLISKMLEGVDVGQLSTVLEPSAGKGDICDYLKLRERLRRDLSIDAIEINPELRATLKGKGYTVVFDDFLKFSTRKVYDLIIANFPFSEGDRHLQRALALLEESGGNLVCLVNAETLRNPHTNLRAALVEKLTKHSAQIEYLSEQFTQAERRTTVEVALIRVSIPRPEPVSFILDSLQKAAPVDVQEQEQKELVEGEFLGALVARFNLECRAGIALIEEFFRLKPLMLDELPREGAENKYAKPLIGLEVKGAYESKASYINSYLAGARHKYWALLLNDPRFTSAYTSNILQELHQKLEALRECDFNLFNIRELEAELQSKIMGGIEASIMKLFDELSRKFAWSEEFDEGNIHYFTGWRTNKAHKINSKVIVPINGFSAWNKDRLDYSIQSKLTDMVKVFNYLAGDLADVPRLVGNTIARADRLKDFKGIDLRYFEVTFFKKGTAHIRFKSQKLLDKFNIYGAQRRGWLPPSYGRKTYTEMDREERQVVDAFQGAEKYAEVMKEPDYFTVRQQGKLLSAPNELNA